LLGGDFQKPELKKLDAALYQSWMELHNLNDFQSFLSMEELPVGLTVDECINLMMVEKSKRIAWQVKEIRSTFDQMLPISELERCFFSANELQVLLSGELST
jgi:hypothetical protein